MKSALIFVCVLGVLVQNAFGQAIGIPNGGCGCGNNLLNSGFGSGLNGINLGYGNEIITTNLGNSYGFGNCGAINAGTSSVGQGDVAVVGELPIVGSTAVTGNLPVIGYITFEGMLPAGGLVSLLNNGCGCSFS